MGVLMLALSAYLALTTNSYLISQQLTSGKGFSFAYNAIVLYGEAMSPFLIWSWFSTIEKYRIGERQDLISVAILVAGAYLVSASQYWHFSYDLAWFAFVYLLLTKIGFSGSIALSLSWMNVICADQIWQIPFYLWSSLGHPWQWTASWLMTAGWAFMAIPLFLRFTMAETGKLKVNVFLAELLMFDLTLLAYGVLDYAADPFPYYLFSAWALFFPALAWNSIRK